MTLKQLAGAAVLAAVATGAAADSKFEHFGSVEGWNVFIDHEKNSCMIESIDSLENVVQMGLTKERDVAYLGVFTKAETSIKKDDKQAVAILIGSNLYTGEVTGMRGNITKGYTGGYVLTDDPQFVEDLAKQYEMIVFPETSYSFIMDLSGTYKAIEMGRECNQKVLAN
ncbi:hypothetical protein Q8W37_04310 [Shimia thalassica]|uniref:hypothetical protein n=1 Tax=Shimia thalassica TaxID=1715693 RepID=UPI000C07BEC5|nr:hypothetical protein [Shimia thalassica]PHO04476.1 hypothetical protein CSC82_07410 [Rhodobacteraceae bacterium 4F10]MBU2943562.1 hypothetical protein [Shimia thalassica]MDO6478635.1 hypothetical protein [Shimia thalassica]MDO6484641.1 hypothetical protein [Shimia thalassica]MDO6501632.1 hypothetical protein [Shimia thalassica]